MPLASHDICHLDEAGARVLYVDASSDHGYCTWTARDSTRFYATDSWERSSGANLPIHVNELYTSSAYLVSFAIGVGGTDVHSFTNNALAQQSRRGSSATSRCVTLGLTCAQ